MRGVQEIIAMQDRIDSGIREGRWDPALAAAHDALGWVLGAEGSGVALEVYLAIPATDRRRIWIARGGDPEEWPPKPIAGPVRPGEEPTT